MLSNDDDDDNTPLQMYVKKLTDYVNLGIRCEDFPSADFWLTLHNLHADLIKLEKDTEIIEQYKSHFQKVIPKARLVSNDACLRFIRYVTPGKRPTPAAIIRVGEQNRDREKVETLAICK